ncbi:MAG: helix-turn-helix transcriptional regulator [Gemmataceae bacterium]|nr:helix-turn-helix transcriptional regulator [Gemmataceae bacterium]MDW8244472.1 helix-turn-helix transcriptional regulator [Thermogemmata sp.]
MPAAQDGAELARKIARLVEEKGWNQEDFARIARLNRHTVRHILRGQVKRQLRNATISQCAEALGLTVSELRDLPLDCLLARMRGRVPPASEAIRLLRERAALPELIEWLDTHPDRAAQLTVAEVQELLAAQEPGGYLHELDVETALTLLEHRRRILDYLRRISDVEVLHAVEQLVAVLANR